MALHTFNISLHDRVGQPGPSKVYRVDNFEPGSPIAVVDGALYEFKGANLPNHPFYFTTDANGGGSTLFEETKESHIQPVDGSYPVSNSDSVFMRFTHKPGTSIYLECSKHRWMGFQIYVLNKEMRPVARDFSQYDVIGNECNFCGTEKVPLRLQCDCIECDARIKWCCNACMEEDEHHYLPVDDLFDDVIRDIPVINWPERTTYVTKITGIDMETKTHRFKVQRILEVFEITFHITGRDVLAEVRNAVGDVRSANYTFQKYYGDSSPREVVTDRKEVFPPVSLRKVVFDYEYNKKTGILQIKTSVVDE